MEENVDHIILIKNFTKSRLIDYHVDINILLIARLEKGGIMLENKKYIALGLILLVGLMTLSCAPGNDRWDQEINPGHTAGFWTGIWHGLIIVITFIISLFTNEVGLYEISNTGWSYNLGFLIGLMISLGGVFRQSRRRPKIRKKDWDRIGDEVEEKVRTGIKAWLDETDKKEKEKEWEEIAKKVEEKIKKALKEWAEKK